MDPNKAFHDMVQANMYGNDYDARELAIELKEWLSKNEYHPPVMTRDMVDAYIEIVLKRTRWVTYLAG